MGTILGSWSAMRKYLEKEMLADSLTGRIRYICTPYVNMGREWKVFEINIDNRLIKCFSYESVQSWCHKNGVIPRKDTKLNSMEFWDSWWKMPDKIPMSERTEYTEREFCSALESYRNSDIVASQTSPDPIQKMFAVLDRRTGKRALLKIKENMRNDPAWLNEVISVRLEAEHIAI